MRVLLTGASGQLGSFVVGGLRAAGHDVVAWSGREAGDRDGVRLLPVDLTDADATERALEEADPAGIIHAAALSTIDGVRLDPERGWTVNVSATGRLAAWCKERGRKFVFTSTDLVFDGTRGGLREDDPTGPLTAYGRSKLAAEPLVLESPGGIVARMSLMYGPARGGRPTYLDRTVAGLRNNEPQTFFSDEFRTPLDLFTAAEILARLVTSEFAGKVHVGGPERLSRYEMARRVAAALGLDPALVRANRQNDVPFHEPRAADVSLDTSRLATLLPDLRRPPLEEAVAAMFDGR
jgi:dTDP-4-dehydrorhamnose reductase